MKNPKKKAVSRPSPALKPVDTMELCKELAAMAGFIENRRVREKIYKAVRQLQLLEKAVADAGLPRS